MLWICICQTLDTELEREQIHHQKSKKSREGCWRHHWIPSHDAPMSCYITSINMEDVILVDLSLLGFVSTHGFVLSFFFFSHDKSYFEVNSFMSLFTSFSNILTVKSLHTWEDLQFLFFICNTFWGGNTLKLVHLELLLDSFQCFILRMSNGIFCTFPTPYLYCALFQTLICILHLSKPQSVLQTFSNLNQYFACFQTIISILHSFKL